MTKSRKLLSIVLALALMMNVVVISATATLGDGLMTSMDIDIVVGTGTGAGFTPLAPGAQPASGSVLTVRLVPTSDFYVASQCIRINVEREFFTWVNSSFQLNPACPYFNAVSSFSGNYGTIPESAFTATSAYGPGLGSTMYAQYSAGQITCVAASNAPNGGFGEMYNGTWFCEFQLNVIKNIAAGSDARVYIDSIWLRNTTNTSGGMYFNKCETASTPASSATLASKYNCQLDVAGADISLPTQAQTSTITFNTAGGSAISPLTGTIGAPVPHVDDPTRTGFTFAGWDQPIPATFPASDLTLTATWNINYYDITFNAAGGEGGEVQHLPYGITPIPPTVNKEGYTFAGWDPAVVPVTGDATYTATWDVNTYNANFYVDKVLYQTVPTPFGSAITPPADPVKEGYTFTGWDTIPQSMPAYDVNIDATFGINTYNANFYVDGVLYQAVPTQFGNEIIPPADPGKEGYTFTGWDNIPAAMPAGDVSINAQFTVNTYDARFYVDGVLYATVPTQYGEAIDVPDDPDKTGHTFTGWDFVPAQMPANDVDINAQFTVNVYNADFAVDGVWYATVPTKFGDVIVPPADPTKVGYTFTGWDPVPGVMGDDDMTFNAQFTINTWTATFYVDGAFYSSAEYHFGDTIVPPADPVKEGATFMGWNPVPGTMADHNMDFYAVFEGQSYNANFYADGVLYETISVPYGAAVTLPATEPSKTGHTFNGWINVPQTMPANDINIDAAWVINTYIAYFMVDGTSYQEVPTKYGAQIVLPADPAKEGFTFTGWDNVPATMPDDNVIINATFTTNTYNATFYVDGSFYAGYLLDYGAAVIPPAAPSKVGYTFTGWDPEPGVMGAEDLTFNAQFTINNWTATFYVDGGVYSQADYDYGTAIALPAAPEKTGYTFTGWDPVPGNMGDADENFNAQFTINSYQLSFYVDGGPYATIDAQYGTPIPSNIPPAPVKVGYIFTGWDAVIPATMPAENQSFNAMFIPEIHNAVFMVNGEVYATVPTAYDAAIAPPADPYIYGYTFTGWDPTPGTMGLVDQVFNATFELNPNESYVVTAAYRDTYYGGYKAPFDIKVMGRPAKLQIVNVATGATLTYDRRLAPDILSIQGYDADNESVPTTSAALAYEIWTINANLLETDYRIRAKINDVWEPLANSHLVTITFDAPELTTFAVADDTVFVGDQLVFTVVTDINVNKIQLLLPSGLTLTYTIDYAVYADDDVAGTRTWTVTRTANTVGDFTWGLRIKFGSVWADVGLTVDFSVEAKIPVVIPVETSVVVNPNPVTKGQQFTITVITALNVDKIQLVTPAGSTMTYKIAYANYSDNTATGERTWTIPRTAGVIGDYSWTLKTGKVGENLTDSGLTVEWQVIPA